MEIKNIINKIKKELPYLRENFGVDSIGVFGSYIRAEQRKDSDLDILVRFYRPIDFFKFIELEEYLSQVLKIKIDLVSEKGISPYLKSSILNEVQYA